MSEESFHRVISDHLALCERNRRLEHRMPLDSYREQVSRDQDEPRTERVAPEHEHWLDPDASWDTTAERPLPEFDWGDD